MGGTVSAVNATPSTTNYMRAIQVPTPPTLVSRLSIRSQADLQEALRIKQTTERQEQHLYSPPSQTTRDGDTPLAPNTELAEVKEAEEREGPAPGTSLRPPINRPSRLTPQSSLGSVSEEQFAGFFQPLSIPSTPGTMSPRESRTPSLRPPARGRKPSDFKTVVELKREIRGKVSPAPKGLANKNKEGTYALAESLGINLKK